jgi:hypothetical protein
LTATIVAYRHRIGLDPLRNAGRREQTGEQIDLERRRAFELVHRRAEETRRGRIRHRNAKRRVEDRHRILGGLEEHGERFVTDRRAR